MIFFFGQKSAVVVDDIAAGQQLFISLAASETQQPNNWSSCLWRPRIYCRRKANHESRFNRPEGTLTHFVSRYGKMRRTLTPLQTGHTCFLSLLSAVRFSTAQLHAVLIMLVGKLERARCLSSGALCSAARERHNASEMRRECCRKVNKSRWTNCTIFITAVQRQSIPLNK